MDIQTIWIIILSIATPVAGVVGFGVQLRKVKKLRLENQKLELELQIKQREFDDYSAQIVKVTNEEVIKYNKPLYSKQSSPSIQKHDKKESIISIYSFGEIMFIVGLIFMLVYFLYDIYRFSFWLWDKF